MARASWSSFLRVAIEGGDSGNVCLLARGDRAVGGFCQMNFLQAVLDHLLIRFVPQLVPQAHGDAPMRHGTVRSPGGNVDEFFFRLFVPEGVQQGHATLKRLLHGWVAGNREGDRSQLRGGQVFVMVAFVFVIGSNCGFGEHDQREK